MTIFNYVLHYKLSCIISLVISHVFLFFLLKNDMKAKLLSIIGSMFLFCGYSVVDYN